MPAEIARNLHGRKMPIWLETLRSQIMSFLSAR
jgi:hypothetical protein